MHSCRSVAGSGVLFLYRFLHKHHHLRIEYVSWRAVARGAAPQKKIRSQCWSYGSWPSCDQSENRSKVWSYFWRELSHLAETWGLTDPLTWIEDHDTPYDQQIRRPPHDREHTTHPMTTSTTEESSYDRRYDQIITNISNIFVLQLFSYSVISCYYLYYWYNYCS